MTCQSNSPPEDRPLKPERAGDENVNQYQRQIDDDIAPQVPVKTDLAAGKTPPVNGFPLLQFDRRFQSMRINTKIPDRFYQISMADRIRLPDSQRPPNDPADLNLAVMPGTIVIHKYTIVLLF